MLSHRGFRREVVYSSCSMFLIKTQSLSIVLAVLRVKKTRTIAQLSKFSKKHLQNSVGAAPKKLNFPDTISYFFRWSPKWVQDNLLGCEEKILMCSGMWQESIRILFVFIFILIFQILCCVCFYRSTYYATIYTHS